MFQALVVKIFLIQALTALGIILTWAIFLPLMAYSGETNVAVAQRQFSALLFFAIISSGWKVGFGLYWWRVVEARQQVIELAPSQIAHLAVLEREVRIKIKVRATMYARYHANIKDDPVVLFFILLNFS